VHAATENQAPLDLRVLPARSTGRVTGVAKVPIPEIFAEIDFAAWLVARMDTLALSTAELRRRSGVNESTISNLREGRAAPGIRVCRKLAVGLEVSLPEMLYVAGHITEDERGQWAMPVLPPVVRDVMERHDPDRARPLTEKEKRMLQAAVRRALEGFDEFLEELHGVRPEPRRR
jgi:transcriptional regulator with XRE-family HTH domain